MKQANTVTQVNKINLPVNRQVNQVSRITLDDLYNEDAEEAVLSILLHNSADWLPLTGAVDASFFSNWERQDIFAAVAAGCTDLVDLAVALPDVNPAYLTRLMIGVDAGAVNEYDYFDHLTAVFDAKLLRQSRAGDLVNPVIGDNRIPDDPLPVWASSSTGANGAAGKKPITTTSELLSRYAAVKSGDMSISDLAGQLWNDPVMAAPARSHFSGEFPESTAENTCKTHWNVDIRKDGDQHQMKAGGVRYRQLSSYITKGGKFINACPHCLHERTIELCRFIERGSEQYTRDNLMRFDTVSDLEAKRIGKRINKRNERDKEGITLSVVKVPQPKGETFILHDAPDIDGSPLPADRGDLYKLIYEKVKHTPKGRRGWRGLSRWGMLRKDAAKPKGQNGGKDKSKKGDLVARLLGPNFGKFATLLRGYLDTEKPITKSKGIKWAGDAADFLTFLDEAGLDYAVVKGDVSPIAHKDKSICVNGDNEGKTASKSAKKARNLPLWEPPERIVEDIPGF